MTTVFHVVIGVDLGDKWSDFCAIDHESGEVVETGRIRSTPEGFRRKFNDSELAQIVVEVGTHSRWTSQLLNDLGHDVLVANPRMLSLIYANDSKNDALDAERLARLGRLDPTLLRPIKHRGVQAQADLSVIKARDALVRSRTLLINTVRGTVKSTGDRIRGCSSGAFPKAASHTLSEGSLLGAALRPILDQIASLTATIRGYDRQIKRVAETQYPETRYLTQVAGVGDLTALAFVLTLEDPGRFTKSRTVGRYLGLTPRQFDSGQSSPQLGITKAGNSYLRRLLVSAAHYVIGPFGPDTDLRRWGLSLASRGGKAAKKRAVVAVARKLAVLLHRLWVTRATYVPLRSELSSSPSSGHEGASLIPSADDVGPSRGKPVTGVTDDDGDGHEARGEIVRA